MISTYRRFYDVIRSVPPGRVTTYGAVADEAGLPGRARQVGYALSALPGGEDIPWHRVINHRGEVSPRSVALGVEQLQRTLLEAEGIVFDFGGRVDLDRFGWP